MKNRLLGAALTAALVLGTGGALWAQDYDVGASAPPIPSTIGSGDDVYFYSGDGTVDDGQQGTTKSITITDPSGPLTIGESSGNAGKGFSYTIKEILNNGGGALNIVAAPGSGGMQGSDVTVSLDKLGSIGGVINLQGSASGKVALTVTDFDVGGFATITVGDNSLLNVTGTSPVAMTNVNLNLTGGDASFAGAVALTGGAIKASADSNLAVGGGLSLNSYMQSPEMTSIGVDGNVTLTVLVSLDAADVYGDITLGDDFNYVALPTAGASLDIQNGGTLRAGALTLKDGAAFHSVNTQQGTVHVDALNIDNMALDTVNTGFAFVDEAGVDTIVEGATAVGEYAQYIVAGSGNQYRGGMTVEGLLDNDGDTAILLGAAGERGVLEIDGGSIRNVTSDAFAINNADVHIIAGGAIAALDADTGKLDLSDSNIIATATSGAINTTGGIEAKSYTQTAGTMTVDGGGNKLVVLEKAVIGDVAAAGDVIYATGSGSTVFQGGVILVDNGKIASTAAGAVIGLGSATVAADLELAGGAALDGATAKLSFADVSGLGTAQAKVTGSGNTATEDIDLSAFNLIVNSGVSNDVAIRVFGGSTDGLRVGSVTVAGGELALGSGGTAGLLTSQGDVTVGTGGVLSASGSVTSTLVSVGANTVRVESGGTLSAAMADFSVANFDKVIIDGTYTAGYILGSITKMTTNAEVVFGAGASIALTNELAMAASAGNVVLTSTASTISLGGAGTWTSMFGTFDYTVNGQNVEITAIANQVTGDTDADRLRARANLYGMWGSKQLGPDLADIVFGATVLPYTITNPSGGAAGDKNLGIFDAIANSTGKNIGRDTVEYVNGAHLYGVTDVAMETSRAFFSDVASRAKVVNSQFVAARESLGSMDALASTAMNAELSNRMWAGGFGLWQNAGEKNAFSGYKYSSGGVILGYDRAVGQGLVLGVSAAYTAGDYKDKGALAHDSDIQSWSGGLYGVYSTCAGFFATVYGGYTYSDNDLRELRRDPSSGTNAWAEADFHTNTWSVGGNAGWDFRPSQCLTLTPSVGLNYIRARNGDHSSWLGGVATQGVRSARNSGLFLPVEATVQYDMPMGDSAKVCFEAVVGYAYNFEKDGLDGSISYFDLVGPGGAVTAKIRSRDNARHSYKVGGGLRYQQGVFDIGMRYDYTGKSGYDAHRLMGTLGLSF